MSARVVMNAARGFQGGFRQSMSWLHTWVGLVLSVVLYFMFITGSAGYFNTEIDRWMQPELPVAAAAKTTELRMIEMGLEHLQQKMPQGKEWYVSLPNGRRDPYLSIYGMPQPGADGKEGKALTENLDAATGQPYPQARETGGGAALYAMHYALHYLPHDVAIYIVGIATMFMFVALITGIVVHKKIFADFFTFRPGKGQRSWLDAHNLTSVLALPFFVVITYSGLVFYTYEYMPSVRAATYGIGEEARKQFAAEEGHGYSFYETKPVGQAVPLKPIAPLLAIAQARWGEGNIRSVSVVNAGDANARIEINKLPYGDIHPRHESMWFDGVSGAVLFDNTPPTTGPETFSGVIIAIHEGHFAPTLLRWLYFASGLTGAAMIATGLLLWTAKRRRRLGANGTPDAGLRFIEHFNVGIITGLPIGIAAYFWANRLLPINLPARDEWEMHLLFGAWAAMLLHAAIRPTSRAWIEQLTLATVLYGCLPILNAITTEIHLGRTLPAGDWVRAGFDLTLVVLAALFACMLKITLRRQQKIQTSLSTRQDASSAGETLGDERTA